MRSIRAPLTSRSLLIINNTILGAALLLLAGCSSVGAAFDPYRSAPRENAVVKLPTIGPVRSCTVLGYEFRIPVLTDAASQNFPYCGIARPEFAASVGVAAFPFIRCSDFAVCDGLHSALVVVSLYPVPGSWHSNTQSKDWIEGLNDWVDSRSPTSRNLKHREHAEQFNWERIGDHYWTVSSLTKEPRVVVDFYRAIDGGGVVRVMLRMMHSPRDGVTAERLTQWLRGYVAMVSARKVEY